MNELDIFSAALEVRSPEERARYLDRACGDNRELRRRIDELLGCHAQVGSFMNAPAPAQQATIHDPISERAGTVIGPYKLLQEIGEGGMGTVFMAEQTHPVQRKVALKIIKPGMDSRQVIARFEAERQALALMDHPNIAKVLDAGTTDTGRPYFVMELVKGIPITKHCDDNHLTPRERLELFIPVCHAVQHAHQKGIIHRDIKPSNVLVALYDGRPVPKVIDFGVAKAISQKLTERTMFTQFGQIVGTLEYMSPEQADLNQLDIDTRSDIYSLGVLLYELLTGTTPFERKRLRGAAFDELLRIIREEEPPKPSTRLSTTDELSSIAANRKTEPRKLSGVVRGELDWIVMKALEKDRNRRYETANSFAMDVHRYLADEPVQACPPSAGYRLRKFARRNKAALLTMSIVTGLICVLAIGSVASALIIWQEQQRAEAERQRAESNFRQTLDAVDKLLTEVGQNELASMPHLEHVRSRLLERALQFYESFLHEKGDDPTVRFEAAMAHRRVADIRRLLGQPREGEETCAQAITILERLVTEAPAQSGHQLELARAHHSRCSLLADLGRGAEAEQANLKTRKLLEKLRSEDPANPAYPEVLAASWDALGVLQTVAGRLDEAESAHDHSVELLTQLAAKFPAKAEYQTGLVRSISNVANLLSRLGKQAEAENAHHEVLATAEKARSRFPDDRELRKEEIRAHLKWGTFLMSTNRLREAQETLGQAARLAENLSADFPHIPDYRQNVASIHNNLTPVFMLSGQTQEALAAIEQAGKVMEKLAEDYPTVPYYHHVRGGILHNFATIKEEGLDQPAEARALLEMAIHCQQRAIALNPKQMDYRSFLRNHYINLAKVLMQLGVSPAEQDEAHAQAIATARELVAESPEVGDYQDGLGNAIHNWAVQLNMRGQWEKVPSIMEEAIQHQEAALRSNPDHPQFLRLLRARYRTLGEAHYRMGLWRKAIEALENAIKQPTDGNASELFFLAMAHWQSGNKDEAHKYFDQAVGWMEKSNRKDELLDRYRAEAEGLIKNGAGIGNQQSENKQPVES